MWCDVMCEMSGLSFLFGSVPLSQMILFSPLDTVYTTWNVIEY